jgi:HSP20 family protein
MLKVLGERLSSARIGPLDVACMTGGSSNRAVEAAQRVDIFHHFASWEIRIMSAFYFGNDLFGELDRLQRQVSTLFGNLPSSIRLSRTDAFPPLNIGTTDDSINIVAFAPGIDPQTLEVTVDKGTLNIVGERKAPEQRSGGETRSYARERFFGTFRRVIELPQNADPDKVEAGYVNGCLTIQVGKREASKPRSISIQ